MSLRDILVYLDQSQSAERRLQLAVDLARRHSARITAIYVWECNPAQLSAQRTSELGLASAEAMTRQARGVRAAIDDRAERLRSLLETLAREHGIEWEWRGLEGFAASIVPQHARYADLCVLSEDLPDDPNGEVCTFSERLLFTTGRPVLFVPTHQSTETLGRHVAIAWNSSRAAARAVQDALPLIERAEHTTVLTINPVDFIDRRGALPASHLVSHLRRHGATVDLRQLSDVPPAAIAETLQREAHRRGADILVAGAFGHPKLWEKLLGGVTESLLSRMMMPIQMSY